MKKYQAQLVIGVSFECEEPDLEILTPGKLERMLLQLLNENRILISTGLNTDAPTTSFTVTYEATVEE